jgi:NADP-dependent 3-hydroxy acid dehydrogenase YdfG
MAGIKDKVVVITGASSGIGEATALMLSERGAKVVLGWRSCACKDGRETPRRRDQSYQLGV